MKTKHTPQDSKGAIMSAVTAYLQLGTSTECVCILPETGLASYLKFLRKRKRETYRNYVIVVEREEVQS